MNNAEDKISLYYKLNIKIKDILIKSFGKITPEEITNDSFFKNNTDLVNFQNIINNICKKE